MRARRQTKRSGSRHGSSLPGLVSLLLLGAVTASPRASVGEQAVPTVSEQIRQAGLTDAASVDLARWHHGPVRYLLRGPEITFYRSLATDEERLAFIRLFWLRRDPDSASLTNKARRAFWERVAAANELFTHSAVPGWRTDMGRVYILMGPPNDREWDSMPGVPQGITVRTPSGAVELGALNPRETLHGIERWTYDSPAGSGLPPSFVIAFRRQPDGDFVMSANPRDISRFADSLNGYIPPLDSLLGTTETKEMLRGQTMVAADARPGDTTPVLPTRGAINPGREPLKGPIIGGPPAVSANVDIDNTFNRMALALDLGRIEDAPDPDRLVGELITSREFFGVVPLLLQPGFYKTTSRATVTALTVGIHRSHLAADDLELRLAARIERIDRPGSIRLLSDPARFLPSPDNGPGQPFVLHQALVRLPPGRYQAVVGIYDPRNNWIGSSESRLEVPAFDGGELNLSTITQARRLTPLEEAGPLTPHTAIDPFRVGHFELVPRMTSGYASGEELSIYYQVYGTTPEPGSGEPHLTVTYRLFALEQDGNEREVGEPLVLAGLTRAVQGWSLPIQDWPHGAYRLAVTVRDEVSGATGSGRTFFSVGDEPTVETAAN